MVPTAVDQPETPHLPWETSIVGDGAMTTPTAVRISGLDRESWTHWVVSVSRLQRATSWWLGDLLAYGEAEFGIGYAQAAELTGRQPQTLRNYAWVARRFRPEERNPALAWGVHRVVAALKVQSRSLWLAKAEKHRWNADRLREEIAARRRAEVPMAAFPPITKADLHTEYECPSCRFRWSGNPTAGRRA
jgi:hypothetical protein